MLILYTADNRPYATVNDPVPEGYRDFLAGEGTGFLEIMEADLPADLFTHRFVAAGALAERPLFEVADAIALVVGQSITLNLPAGTSISVDDEAPAVLETTELEITGEMPATYTLSLENWPYVPKQIEVTIHEA